MGGISSYEFFVGYVGIFLTIIASLVILGLLFRKRYSWLLLVMVICLFIGRIVLKVEMWMYGLIPFISGLIVSSLYDLYYKIQGDKGKFIND